MMTLDYKSALSQLQNMFQLENLPKVNQSTMTVMRCTVDMIWGVYTFSKKLKGHLCHLHHLVMSDFKNMYIFILQSFISISLFLKKKLFIPALADGLNDQMLPITMIYSLQRFTIMVLLLHFVS